MRNEEIDFNPLHGTSYYRFKLVDLQENAYYSSNQTITYNEKYHVSLYPNPVMDKVTFQSSTIFNSLRIIDVRGVVLAYKRNVNSTKHSIDVINLESGLYFYELRDGSHVVGVGRFIKQ